MTKYYKKIDRGQSKQGATGFTLIEILVSSAILVILASGFLGFQYIISQSQITAWVSYQSIESANIAISAMRRELRNATQSESGAYPLITTDDQEIIFYGDHDFDGEIERVRYALNGTQLIKGTIEPSGIPASYDPANEIERVLSEIIRNGTDPIFYYYNSDWPTDTTNNPLLPADRIADTRYIKIILTSNSKSNSPEFDYVLESDTKLRMLSGN